MDLKITGIVKEVLAEQAGSSAKGAWRKREFILETEGKYPKRICMVQWGDSIDNGAVGVGQKLTASIDIASREHNGRWYTDVKAWKVEREAAAPAAGPPAGYEERADKALKSAGIAEPDDDLPF